MAFMNSIWSIWWSNPQRKKLGCSRLFQALKMSWSSPHWSSPALFSKTHPDRPDKTKNESQAAWSSPSKPECPSHTGHPYHSHMATTLANLQNRKCFTCRCFRFLHRFSRTQAHDKCVSYTWPSSQRISTLSCFKATSAPSKHHPLTLVPQRRHGFWMLPTVHCGAAKRVQTFDPGLASLQSFLQNAGNNESHGVVCRPHCKVIRSTLVNVECFEDGNK